MHSRLTVVKCSVMKMRTNVPVPRYTSYPTVPFWEERESEAYTRSLLEYAKRGRPLSLYVHIPFCKKRCLFCGCHVILNRKEGVANRYVRYVNKEIDLLKGLFPNGYPVRLLHLGGGTPTHLTNRQMGALVGHLKESFVFLKDAEQSVELDARTLEADGTKLPFLKELGFNRVSFGVQDTNELVQRAVHRDQSLETTRKGYAQARRLGFKSICIELIYGLPFQTKRSFHQTIQEVISLRPDRIAMYSFANVPWIKPHQEAIRNIPTPTLKLALYVHAKEELLRAGYLSIGMDHFALPSDELATGTLVRCFQGYTTEGMDENIGLGVSSIGFFNDEYFQNEKDLSRYESIVDSGHLPAARGKTLSEDDTLRKWVIHRLMCLFRVDKREFALRFGLSFDLYFEKELSSLSSDEVINTPDQLQVSENAQLFIRNVASCFDAYYHQRDRVQFSQSI